MKRDDAHYNVRLLTEYFFRVPEGMRPASFDECTSLFCMQTAYYHAGTITEESSISSMTSYYPFFTALDMVAVYDLSDPHLNNCFYLQTHPAQVEDDAWFAENKSNSFTLLSSSNMLGDFDEETLKGEYDVCMDRIEVLQFYWLFDESDTGEEETNDAE